jgi:hypothetical protein
MRQTALPHAGVTTHVEGTAGVGVGCTPAYVHTDLSDLYLVEILVSAPASLSI